MNHRFQTWVAVVRQVRQNYKAWRLALFGMSVSVGYMWFAYLWTDSPAVLSLATIVQVAIATTLVPRFAIYARKIFLLLMVSNGLLALMLLLVWFSDALLVLLVAGILLGVAVCGNNLVLSKVIARQVELRSYGVTFLVVKLMTQLGGVIGAAAISMLSMLVGNKMSWLCLPLLLVSSVAKWLFPDTRPSDWELRGKVADDIARGDNASSVERNLHRLDDHPRQLSLRWFALQSEADKGDVIRIFLDSLFYLELLRQRLPKALKVEVHRLSAKVERKLLGFLKRWWRTSEDEYFGVFFLNTPFIRSVTHVRRLHMLHDFLVMQAKKRAQQPERTASYQVLNIFRALELVGVVDVASLKTAYTNSDTELVELEPTDDWWLRQRVTRDLVRGLGAKDRYKLDKHPPRLTAQWFVSQTYHTKDAVLENVEYGLQLLYMLAEYQQCSTVSDTIAQLEQLYRELLKQLSQRELELYACTAEINDVKVDTVHAYKLKCLDVDWRSSYITLGKKRYPEPRQNILRALEVLAVVDVRTIEEAYEKKKMRPCLWLADTK